MHMPREQATRVAGTACSVCIHSTEHTNHKPLQTLSTVRFAGGLLPSAAANAIPILLCPNVTLRGQRSGMFVGL